MTYNVVDNKEIDRYEKPAMHRHIKDRYGLVLRNRVENGLFYCGYPRENSDSNRFPFQQLTFFFTKIRS